MTAESSNDGSPDQGSSNSGAGNSGAGNSDEGNSGAGNSDRSKSDSASTPDASEPSSPEEGGPPGGVPREITSEAVKTFEFEVSAGNSPGKSASISSGHSAEVSARHPVVGKDLPSPLPNVPQSRLTIPVERAPEANVGLGKSTNLHSEMPHGAGELAPIVVERGSGKVGHSSDAVEFASKSAVLKRFEVAPIALLPFRQARRQSSWWIVSLGLHAVLLVILAFSTLVVLREPEQLELYTSPAVYETVDDITDLEIDPTDELESLEEDRAYELHEPSEFAETEAATFADLSSAALFDQQVVSESTLNEAAAAHLTSSLVEIGQLFGENGSGMSEMGSGTGGAMAKFFGTEVKARRILYMLDNSGGMLQGGKFESLVSELQASISVLDAKQKFYVIFFSDTVYPLFYPQSVRRFMPATDRTRKQLQRWLDSVELCTGNAIDEALAAAEVIRPDAVFLLTDGNLFTTEKKKALLLNPSGRRYSIHTFGLGVGTQTKTAEGLKQVAEANEGTFRAIKVSAATKELANEKQRPYHSKQPGAVWGLKVGLR